MKKVNGLRTRFLAGCLAMVTGLGICLGGIPFEPRKAQASGIQPVVIAERFPDAKFRAVISGRDYDRNGDGILDAEEIASTINVKCEGKGIQSLAGVEVFVNLQGLWCKDNQLTSLNISNLKELRGLWCSGNKLTSLDLTSNTKLEWVYCFDCKLTALDVSKNPKMAFIECNTNPIKELDVTHNPELEHLTCGTCQLTKLDLSNNPKLAHLDAFRNKLTKLDVTHNPKLKRLDIWDNPGLGSIDISKNTGLQYYNCANNGATSINVSNNPELQKLICSYNYITKLDVSHNPKLVYLDCGRNEISSLNLSKNTKLYFLQAFTNKFTTLDISNNPLLVKTYQTGKKKAEPNVGKASSWTLNYGGDTSTGGDNIYFLCVDDVVKITAASSTGPTSTPTPTPTPKQNTTNSNLVTREAVAQRLYEMAGKPSVSGLKTRFKDVKAGTSYYNALLWGQEYSICVGTPDISSDTFGVGQYITIQDLTLMLMRYSEYRGYKRAIDFGRSDDFSDYYDVDYYAWEAICWAVTWGIYEGKGDPNAPKEQRKLDPHGKATRAEFEEMLKRMLEVNKGVTPITPTPTAKPTPSNVTPTPKPNGVTPTPTQASNGVTPTPTQAPIGGTPTPAPTPIDGTPSPTPTPADGLPSPTPTPAGTTPTPSGADPGENIDRPEPTEVPGVSDTPNVPVSDGKENIDGKESIGGKNNDSTNVVQEGKTNDSRKESKPDFLFWLIVCGVFIGTLLVAFVIYKLSFGRKKK